MDHPSFVRRYPTGVTIAGFFVAAIALSLAPVPSWMKPLDLLDTEDPLIALRDALLQKPESIPLPDQQHDQVQAAGDPLLLDGAPASEDPPAEVAVVTATRSDGPRQAWRMPPRPVFDRYAARLGLSAAPLERFCRTRGEGGGCRAQALDRFFSVLERVEEKRPGEVARVMHFGDSLIASDKISDRVRMRFQERFGSGGRGFLLAKRFNQFQRGRRSGRGSDGWSLDVITASIEALPDRHFGFSGASFTAKAAGETLVFEPVGPSRYLDIFFLAEPGGGALELLADERSVGRLDTRGNTPRGTMTSYVLPEATETLTLRSEGPGARIYGVNLEARVPGVLWSTLGLPGATSEVWLRPDRDEFVRLLAERPPDLAVVMLGGNDGLMLSKKRVTLEAIERDTSAFVERVRAASPAVDCLLVSPLEAVRAKGGGRLIPKPEVPMVIRVLRRVAERHGCGFWDMYASMGGRGSLKRWVKARLMLGDLIHPRSRGSDLLGEMMAEAMMRAYDERPRGPSLDGDRKPSPDPAPSDPSRTRSPEGNGRSNGKANGKSNGKATGSRAGGSAP